LESHRESTSTTGAIAASKHRPVQTHFTCQFFFAQVFFCQISADIPRDSLAIDEVPLGANWYFLTA
jgi:hypothetical protein